jgi:His/Glu/Gln/Arg/opine family amino acid ABC transporter permease subunit
MRFLWQVAGFDISEGIVVRLDEIRTYTSGDTNSDALFAGLVNTIKVAVLAILLATLFGTLLGVGRLSRNWLLRQISFGLVEVVRNTPMLIQLVFWYFAVVLKLPLLSDAANGFGAFVLSRNGLFLPALSLGDSSSNASILVALIAVVLLLAAVRRTRWRSALVIGGALGLLASWAMGLRVSLTLPQVADSVVHGGIGVSPEFAALLIGLTVYTASFVAEIVRGAIVTLPKGQWEAAAALGLGRWATFTDVVIPQVFRVVLPACGNQYISLAKTTSLGIAIGFPDLFNVYGTVTNQSGRSLEGVIVIMLTYLLLSWAISAIVNVLNRRLLAAGGVS